MEKSKIEFNSHRGLDKKIFIKIYPFINGLYNVNDVVELYVNKQFVAFGEVVGSRLVHLDSISDTVTKGATNLAAIEFRDAFREKYHLDDQKNPLMELIFLQISES